MMSELSKGAFDHTDPLMSEGDEFCHDIRELT